MSERTYSERYLLESDDEPLRLERQARIYGDTDDLRYLALSSGDQVLDAGCGSGIIARTIAGAVPQGLATGIDRDPQYINFAQRKAAQEGLANIHFEVGDVLGLPFGDATFDVVWSKHLLQWVKQKRETLAEFKRVVRPGGRIVCCNFDGFCAYTYPVDVELQRDIDLWFETAARELDFDNFIGRKLPSLLLEAGLKDLKVDFIPDRAFGGFGGDPEKFWNWQVQWEKVIGFSARVFGSVERAQQVTERFLKHYNSPNVYAYCTLFYVEGRVP